MYVICYSGGHSSALCAIEAVRKHGKDKVILLNNNISSMVEDRDIKRFKEEVAFYLGLPITYANHKTWEETTPIDICVELKAWEYRGNGKKNCTKELKTKPFMHWVKENDKKKEFTYIYGFDSSEKAQKRAQRRAQIMGIDGYKTEFPLISWERTIKSTKEIGIEPPMVYKHFVHANCVGCLKAGWQHWYIVFCQRPDLWQQAKEAEETIGYSIHLNHGKQDFLEDREEFFLEMKKSGVEATERTGQYEFWKNARRKVKEAKANISYEQLDLFAKHDESVCLECMV